MPSVEIAGQMNPEERRILQEAILSGPEKPEVVIEVGTWLGGGSTLHLLRSLERNGIGRLWGIEADRSIYDRMLENLRAGAPETLHRFTALFGLSHDVIPRWLKELGSDARVDVAFLDGGDNPMEQITEFKLLAPRIPVGGQLLSHDAKLRKGRWLVPYVSALDNWSSQLHDVSEEGLFHARKVNENASAESQRSADLILRRLRLDPVEFIGSILPSGINAALLRLFPDRFIKRITQGRRH